MPGRARRPVRGRGDTWARGARARGARAWDEWAWRTQARGTQAGDRARLRIGVLVVGLAVVGGCSDGRQPLLLASTTSTEDSGLFEVLIPAFEAAHPRYQVRVTAVGTGQALELGRRGDADVLLVHAPAAESAFVAAGHGPGRCDVMYNDFVVVGPAADPAGVDGSPDARSALRRVADSGAPFISRGDDSGTHRRERELWAGAGVEPRGDWYLEVGQGMAETLLMAAEKRAYTLTDRATYLKAGARLDLAVLVEGDPGLFNQYGVIPVARAANSGGAAAFAAWITGPAAQDVIGGYGREELGQPLFVPNAGVCESVVGGGGGAGGAGVGRGPGGERSAG